jgi:aspartyl/glutamyl-tRNA(Asn/Gln) amidotransferase C subunit
MANVDIDVKYVAHLARLSLSPEEEQKIGAQLGGVLGYIEKLRKWMSARWSRRPTRFRSSM